MTSHVQQAWYTRERIPASLHIVEVKNEVLRVVLWRILFACYKAFYFKALEENVLNKNCDS